jgi:hypothetical protein
MAASRNSHPNDSRASTVEFGVGSSTDNPREHRTPDAPRPSPRMSRVGFDGSVRFFEKDFSASIALAVQIRPRNRAGTYPRSASIASALE